MQFKLIFGNKRIFIFIAKLLIALAFFEVLIKNGNISFNELYIVISDYKIFLFSLVFLFTGIILSGIRWWLLLRITNNRLPLKTVLSVQLMGSFFSSWLPGAAGGDAVRGVLLYKLFDSGRSTAFISILIDRIYSIFGLAAVAVLSIIYIQKFTDSIGIAENLIVGLKGVTILLLSLFIMFITVWTLSVKYGLPKLLPVVVRSYISPLGVAFSMYRKSWHVILICAILSILASSIVIVGLIIIASMFSFETEPTYVAIAGVVGNISSVIPVSPGGLGVGEAAFSKVYSELAGDTGSYATIYFTFRIGMLFVNIPGMLITLFYKTSKHRKMSKFTS